MTDGCPDPYQFLNRINQEEIGAARQQTMKPNLCTACLGLSGYPAALDGRRHQPAR